MKDYAVLGEFLKLGGTQRFFTNKDLTPPCPDYLNTIMYFIELGVN
jgi:hypothetical protein